MIWLAVGSVAAVVGLIVWGLAILIEAYLKDWP